MANSLQYLQQLSAVITELQNKLGGIETSLGKVQAASVRFNTQAGQWQGNVAAQSMEGRGRGAGAPFLSREQVNPINQAAEEKYKSTLMEASQLFKQLSKEMGITRENYKLLMADFPKFNPDDLGIKNWTKELETLYIKIENTIREFERLSQVGKEIKVPSVIAESTEVTATPIPERIDTSNTERKLQEALKITDKQALQTVKSLQELYFTTEKADTKKAVKEQKELDKSLAITDKQAQKTIDSLLKLQQSVAGGKISGGMPASGISPGAITPEAEWLTKQKMQEQYMQAAFANLRTTPMSSADTEWNRRLEEVVKYKEELNKLGPIQKRIKETETARAQGLITETVNIQKKTRATQELSKAQVQSLRADPTFQKAFTLLDKEATKFGFNPENMKIIASNEVTTGITRLSANLGTLDGVAHKAHLTVDRFGRTLVDTQRRFRTFGDAIRRDIVEVLKWSIAVGVVYGSIQRLQDLVQTAITNEAKLADVTIALGKTQQDVNVIFESAAEIANKTGESITGVLEGYTLAYRATGNIANEYERIATANKLMADSLTLSSLSGMSQADALDALSASLRQTGMELTQGNELLDKWVRTTQVANVSLQDLAAGFAIVGEAADGAGIKADQLNGIIATIAETGIASSQEIGNVTRALISGYQADRTKKALEEIGIALEDTSGKAKGFEEVVKELNMLRKSGALANEEFTGITLAWGGGFRRQAPVAAFIENYQRVGEVSKESFSASGEASAALAIKLDTVQKSLIRLGNAFQSLAQGLGEKNGLLTVLNTIITLFTKLVELTGKVTSSMGSSLLPLVGILGTMFLLKGRTDIGQKLSLGASSLMTKGISNLPGMGTQQTVGTDWYTLRQQAYPQPSTKAQVIGETYGPRLAAGAFGVLVSGVLPALAEGGKNAGVKIGSSVIGAVVGGLTGPAGALIGASIGSSIGEMYLSYLESKKATLEGLFTLKVIPTLTPEGEPIPTSDEAKELIVEIQKWAEKMSGGMVGNIFPGITNEQWEARMKKVPTGEEARRQVYEETLPGVEYKPEEPGAEALAQEMYYLKYFSDWMEEGRKKIAEEKIEQLKGLYNQIVLTPELKAEESLKTVSSEYQKVYGDLLESIGNSMTTDIKDKLRSGDITVAAAQNAIESLDTFTNLASKWAGILGDKFSDMTEKQMLEMMANITAYTPLENKSDITIYAGAAQDALTKIEELRKQVAESPWENKAIQMALADAIREQQRVYDENVEIAEALIRSAYSQNVINIPAMPRVEMDTLTKTQFPDFFEEMKKLYRQDLETQARAKPEDELTMDWVRELMDNTQTTLFKLSDGIIIKDMPIGMTTIWNELLTETIKQTGLMGGMGYQLGGMTQEQFNAILPQYEAIRSNILYKGGTSEEEAQVIMWDDGQFDVLKKDWKIIQYLLGQIVDNTEKQLEGIYNMPEGASFWFPSSVIPYIQNASSNNGINLANLPGAVAAGIKLAQGGPAGSKVNPQEGSKFWLKNASEPFAAEVTESETWRDSMDKLLQTPAQKLTDAAIKLDDAGKNLKNAIPKIPLAPEIPETEQRILPEELYNRLYPLPQSNLISPTQTENTEQELTFLQQMKAYLIPTAQNTGVKTFTLEDIFRQLNSEQFINQAPEAIKTEVPQLNTKIELTSTIQLVADGRTLASIVAPWLGEFISNFNGTESSSTIKAVI
jgi:TP901 family phage tail tape measure protein